MITTDLFTTLDKFDAQSTITQIFIVQKINFAVFYIC